MDIKTFQEYANKLVTMVDDKVGSKHDAQLTFIHLTEELGEIAREIYNEKSGRGTLDKENLAGELADVMGLLAVLASAYDIDLEQAIIDKFEIIKKRFGEKVLFDL